MVTHAGLFLYFTINIGPISGAYINEHTRSCPRPLYLTLFLLVGGFFYYPIYFSINIWATCGAFIECALCPSISLFLRLPYGHQGILLGVMGRDALVEPGASQPQFPPHPGCPTSQRASCGYIAL